MSKSQKSILLIVALIGIVLIYFLIRYGKQIRVEQETKQATQEQAQIEEEQATGLLNPVGIEIADEIYKYSGTIIKHNDSSIIVHALAKDNKLIKDRDITVLINSSTKYERIVMKEFYKPGQSPLDVAQDTEQAKLGDFKVGERVTVYADENIKGLIEFTASKIESINLNTQN